MQYTALVFAAMASLLSLSAVLAMPQPKRDNGHINMQVPKGKANVNVNSFKTLQEVEITFPPAHPQGSCEICDKRDGCTADGHFLYQTAYTTENGLAYRADSEDYGWWAAQMNRTFPTQQSFAIVNNLKPKTRANLFEIVAMDYSIEDPAMQKKSVWTKVPPGSSCLTSTHAAMGQWQEHMTVVNVYQSIHKIK